MLGIIAAAMIVVFVLLTAYDAHQTLQWRCVEIAQRDDPAERKSALCVTLFYPDFPL